MSKLKPLERLLNTIAKDAPRSTLPERQARAALVAVVVAMHNDSLDKLLEQITGYMQDELSWTDALADGEVFDLLSGALIELGAIEADLDELAALGNENSVAS